MSRRRTSVGDAPLLAWGDALRAQSARRGRLGRGIAATGIGALIMLASAALPPTPCLVWNVSASAPIGLYWVWPGAEIDPGDMVIARLPQAVRQIAAQRRYLPMNVPLVKRVVAVAGDEVCALGNEIFLNRRRIATRSTRDGAGRIMPRWSGCIRLRGRQLFLLMNAPASFDGRYFGVTDRDEVVGKAQLLWSR